MHSLVQASAVQYVTSLSNTQDLPAFSVDTEKFHVVMKESGRPASQYPFFLFSFHVVRRLTKYF
jgi:anaerobic selenocysteine-containing dehydrogenase